ncbi:MAG: SpoVR family protein [Bacteroidetes bacterium GWE2_29_8]|nr:MAG: SpoVR family protein [Bacteroidetes bacterium GWE2_29_8]OFY17158.1 MAG: SpoVR family protein [Bacteroidetes bacterium GWF2_29_10]
MELINQHTKKIMEDCKLKARDTGLSFDNETLEYIVTNRDMIELSPKVMIPTLYDYWVNDVEVLKETGKYKLYPHNPYETVINSRPAISFYNDNNPDWMNIMIFYHVIGHIDFFQNNVLFENTWKDDFVGMALADKRLIENLRSEHGRWVDYVIEFSRSIDNITGFYKELPKKDFPTDMNISDRLQFYFDNFLQEYAKYSKHAVYKEIERYNVLISENKEMGESMFFSEVKNKFPEFQLKYENYKKNESNYTDLLLFIRQNSPLLNKEKNKWMKLVMTIIRNTSIYFGPQMRTKIINEGWASYWHDKLFRYDDRIKGYEVAYSKLNAGVTSISKIGLNPYAIGLRLIEHVEDLANKGKISSYFQNINDIEKRENYNKNTKTGKDAIFKLRSDFSDFMLVNTFTDQDFIDKHNLFVVGERFNQQKGVVEYYIKSKKNKDYKQMLIDSLYHPPVINVDISKTSDDQLYLVHIFEGKQLYKQYISDTMLGLEFLWGGSVKLETTEIYVDKQKSTPNKNVFVYVKVLYTMLNKKLTKTNI